MVPLVRGPAPAILEEKAAAWTAKYLAERTADPHKKPDPRCYGHPRVRVELRRMSGHKCFYCERILTEREQEVDHHIEVAERPEEAFAWSNLYLSCGSCNRSKAPNKIDPVASCVDPCAPSVAPERHLLFDDERIAPRDDSPSGLRTIRKYHLDRDDLNLARLRALQELSNAVIAVLTKANGEGRKPSDDERSLIRAYASPTRPFSLMMRTKLRRLGW
jgi:uncharacterized protein (TIGR02646 family)